MSIANEIIDVLRDWKRIADKPEGSGAVRLLLWQTHVRLKLALLSRRTGLETDVLDYRVAHLGLGSLVHLFREIFVSRVYDVPLDTPTPTIIDCGSNIGMSILFFKDLYPAARVIGFEPHPVVHRTLTRNIERNALNNVVVHQIALGDRRGTLDFFIKADDPGALDMGLFADHDAASAIAVESDVLSRHIDGEVDLLKLDIEGAEEQVLVELAREDKLRFIRHIVCEYHHHIDVHQDRLSRTLATLEQAGFGYQIAAHLGRPPATQAYQDVIIYAYNKAAR